LKKELPQIRESLVAPGVAKISSLMLSKNSGVPLPTILTDYVAEETSIPPISKHKQEVHHHSYAPRKLTLLVNQIHELIADNKTILGRQISSLRSLK